MMKQQINKLLIPFILLVFILSVSFMRSWIYLSSIIPFPMGFLVGSMICSKGWPIRSSKAFWSIVLFGFISYGIELIVINLMEINIIHAIPISAFAIWWYFGGIMFKEDYTRKRK